MGLNLAVALFAKSCSARHVTRGQPTRQATESLVRLTAECVVQASTAGKRKACQITYARLLTHVSDACLNLHTRSTRKVRERMHAARASEYEHTFYIV